MRKQDIKPGVLYAWKRGRSEFDEPHPIVFLNTPADGELYAKTSHHRPPGTPAFIRAREGATPHRVSFGSDVGYPAVRFHRDAEGNPSSLLAITLDDFTATAGGIQAGREFVLITSLAAIAGPWDEVKAARDAQKRADAERRDRERTEADASRTRAIDVLTALQAYGIEASRIAAYGKVDSVSLPLAEAEKLIAVLRDGGTESIR
jgi:hypothetical protein